jgi:hypothetical protein
VQLSVNNALASFNSQLLLSESDSEIVYGYNRRRILIAGNIHHLPVEFPAF